MLVLSRRVNESIIVGDHWRITVNVIRGDAVSLRFIEQFGGRIGELAAEVVTLRPDGERQPWAGVRVSVVNIRGEKVRLGITVPSGTAVHRQEVYEAIRHETDATGDA